jgi:hypothetical protein
MTDNERDVPSVHITAKPYEGEEFTMFEWLPEPLRPLIDTNGEISLAVLRLVADSMLFENEIRRDELERYDFELRTNEGKPVTKARWAIAGDTAYDPTCAMCDSGDEPGHEH